MQGSGEITNPLIATFGAKQTAGFFAPSAYRPNDQTYFPYPKNMHEVKKWLYLMKVLGIPTQDGELEFPITQEEEKQFTKIKHRYSLRPFTYIVIHPGSRSSGRRWDVKKFAQIANALAQQGFSLVLTGSVSETQITKSVKRAIAAPVIDLTGQTSLGELASLLSQARLLIANDTGVSHIASALRVPSVILFTGSEMDRWAPLDSTLHKAVNGKKINAEEQVLVATQELLEYKK
jgi:ADP-heptose:LPS heptosyltransferase